MNTEGKKIFVVNYAGTFNLIVADSFHIDMVDKEQVVIFAKATRVKSEFNRVVKDFNQDTQEEVEMLMWRMAEIRMMYQI